MPTIPTSVVVHPLVLLSTVDHYNRVAKDTKKRVVGVLLGENFKGKIEVTNSFGVPFEEEDGADGKIIWFLDHNFLENMFNMYKKVNAKEHVIGWYSTGPKIRPNDLEINELFRQYTPNPAYVIIDVRPKDLGLPTEAYIALEEVNEKDGKKPEMTFQHVPSEIGALEAEEVGVEHLLRDIKDTSISTLASQVSNKLNAMKGLHSHLQEMYEYLENVCLGRLPVNHEIMDKFQDIYNLLPNLNPQLTKSFAVKTNDMMLVIYLSSLVRAIIALHNLINNKLTNSEHERKALGGTAAVAGSKDQKATDKKDTEKDKDKEKEKDINQKDSQKDKAKH